MRTTALLTALVLALPVAAQQTPKPHPAPTAPLFTTPNAAHIPPNMILSNEDEHGCNYAFYWDAAKLLCTIRLHFPAEVICKPADSANEFLCSYKPKPAEKK